MTDEVLSKQMIQHILDTVDRSNISTWEAKFLISIEAWAKKGNKLSAKQSAALKKLYEKNTLKDKTG